MEWENKLEETKKNSQENRAIINGLKSSINKARNANQKDKIKIQKLANEIHDLTEEKSNQ